MVGFDFWAEVGKGIEFQVMKSLPMRPNGHHTVYAFTAGRRGFLGSKKHMAGRG